MNSKELCIEIQDNTFRFVECKYNSRKKKVIVYKAFQEDIPQEYSALNDGNKEMVIGLIRKALKENGIKNKTYKLCLSHRDIITRVIKLPQMDAKDLNSFMNKSIHQYFPVNAKEYYFDYKIQSINEEDEKGYYNLFMVAIPKTLIEYYSTILLKCGLKPQIINIYSDVVTNFFSNFVNENVAVIDIGYNHTEFVMVEDNSIFINTAKNFAIQKQQNVNEEDYLQSLSEESFGEEFFTTFEDIENYINFYSSRHHGQTIDAMYFIGEGAKLNKIINTLRTNISIKVLTGQELLHDIIITSSMKSQMQENFYPERYIPCYGLLIGESLK